MAEEALKINTSFHLVQTILETLMSEFSDKLNKVETISSNESKFHTQGHSPSIK